MEWWSLGVGIGGLVASAFGLMFAYLARRAAKSAEEAAKDTRYSISQSLCLVSSQRALSVIARLNTLHRGTNWEAALELYRELRTLLNDISGTMPMELSHFKAEIGRSIGQLSLIQSLVEGFKVQNIDPASFPALSETLNTVETTLEALVSNMIPPRGQEGE